MVSAYDAILKGMPLIGPGFIIGLAFAILYYFYSKVLNDKKLEFKAKEHIRKVGEGAVIIVFVLLVSTFLNVLFGQSNLNRGDTHIILAEASLYEFINKVFWFYIIMWGYDLAIVIIYGVAMHFDLQLLGFTFGMKLFPFMALDDVIEAHNKLSYYLVNLMALVFGRLAVLHIAYFMLYLVFPVGLFLYFLPISKKTGASLIALSLAVYYAFPLSVLLSDYLIINPSSGYRGISYSDFLNSKPQNTYFKNIVANAVNPSYYNEFAGFEKIDTVGLVPNINVEVGGITENVINNNSQNIPNDQKLGNRPSFWDVDVSQIALSPKKALKSMIGSWEVWVGGALVVAKTVTRGFSTEGSVVKKVLSIFGKTLSIGLSAETAGIVDLVIDGASILYYTHMLYKFNPLKMLSYFFHFFIKEVFIIGQYAVVLFIAFILEITITVTTYRELATVFGGDATLLGLTKVI